MALNKKVNCDVSQVINGGILTECVKQIINKRTVKKTGVRTGSQV